MAAPLEAINKPSAWEKLNRHGHPSILYLLWARRPLAAAGTVIFAQTLDDPSVHPHLFPTEKAQHEVVYVFHGPESQPMGAESVGLKSALPVSKPGEGNNSSDYDCG